ncbi:MAG: serine/threonine-protein kinase [Bryobacterales bacterium]
MAARIAHYELLERISEGGMGVVYRARDTKLDRLVALKFLSRDLGSCEEDLAAFLHEARAISQLSHPNIATIYAVEEDEGDRFLAFEYLPGGTLKDVIQSAPEPLEMSQIVRWGTHVARALAHAHRHGIVHRDVKSSNVLLTGGRAGKADGLRRRAGRRAARRLDGRDGRNGRLHVAGTGAGNAHRQALGPVFPGRGAVRDVRRPPTLPRRESGGHLLRRSPHARSAGEHAASPYACPL